MNNRQRVRKLQPVHLRPLWYAKRNAVQDRRKGQLRTRSQRISSIAEIVDAETELVDDGRREHASPVRQKGLMIVIELLPLRSGADGAVQFRRVGVIEPLDRVTETEPVIIRRLPIASRESEQVVERRRREVAAYLARRHVAFAHQYRPILIAILE